MTTDETCPADYDDAGVFPKSSCVLRLSSHHKNFKHPVYTNEPVPLVPEGGSPRGHIPCFSSSTIRSSLSRATGVCPTGTWILSAAAPSGILTGLLLNRPGLQGAVGEIAGISPASSALHSQATPVSSSPTRLFLCGTNPAVGCRSCSLLLELLQQPRFSTCSTTTKPAAASLACLAAPRASWSLPPRIRWTIRIAHPPRGHASPARAFRYALARAGGSHRRQSGVFALSQSPCSRRAE